MALLLPSVSAVYGKSVNISEFSHSMVHILSIYNEFLTFSETVIAYTDMIIYEDEMQSVF